MRFDKYSFSPAAKRYIREQVPVISKREAEMKENLMMLGGVAIGLAVGVVIGAAVTALTVPQSGVETRRGIKDKTDFAVNEAKEKSSQVAEKVKGASSCGLFGKMKEKLTGNDENDVVVEYTIRYDDDDAATVEKATEKASEAEAEPAATEAAAEEKTETETKE